MKKADISRAELFLLNLGTSLAVKIGDRNFMIIAAVITGLIAGAAAIVLKYIVASLEIFSHQLASMNFFLIIAFLPVLGVGLAFLIQRLIYRNTVCEKSLSPLIYKLSVNLPDLPFRKTFSHILTSGFCVGLGGSAGLEAPMTLTGSAIGSNLAAAFRVDRKKKTLLLASGAAAGISAIFNSPVAGVLFVAEVLLPEFSVPSLIPILMASASAAVLTKLFYPDSLFLLVSSDWKMEAVPFYVLLGLISSLVGTYMIETASSLSAFIKKRAQTSLRKLIFCLVTLPLLFFFFPSLAGEGYHAVESIFSANASALFVGSPLEALGSSGAWSILLLCICLIAFKVVSNVITVSCGGDGGIFAPSMFTGALTGFCFAHLINLSGLAELNVMNFTAAGMCGVFTSVMRAPMTGIFLIAEVTGGYIIFIPLMIVSAISFFCSGFFGPYSVYMKSLAAQNLISNADRDSSILSRIPVSSVLEKDNFAVLRQKDNFRRFIEALSETHRNIFPVLDEAGRLCGVVTLDSVRPMLLDSSLYDSLLIYDVMTEIPAVLKINDQLARAMSLFDMYGLWYLPVVDEKGRYIGFASRSSILSRYRELIKESSLH